MRPPWCRCRRPWAWRQHPCGGRPLTRCQSSHHCQSSARPRTAVRRFCRAKIERYPRRTRASRCGAGCPAVSRAATMGSPRLHTSDVHYPCWCPRHFPAAVRLATVPVADQLPCLGCSCRRLAATVEPVPVCSARQSWVHSRCWHHCSTAGRASQRHGLLQSTVCGTNR